MDDPPPTPGARLRAALQTLGWGVRDMAEAAGYNDRRVRYWCADNPSPPAEVLAWIENLAASQANKPPETN
jgi:hypothetical protein